ncbi:MAG: peptidoglycan DD-metalloendopeptidase family protein [Ekhidna sp.]|uniref:peptidoglycan DD-metalloendopeptidase family protein n=1 Tax=Ekhidna sp. TaxID=2608089 RepID=UPI0032EC328B
MIDIVFYLLKVIAIHGLLYLFFRLMLSRSARHSLNRMYLLAAVFLAFFIPFIELPISTSATILPSDDEITTWLSEPSGQAEFDLIPVQKEADSFSYYGVMLWIYCLVAGVFIIRSIFYLISLHRLKIHSEYIRKRWFRLYKTSHARPFSFFSNVFMPKSLFGAEAFGQILAHECVHVRQFHSVDRLVLDFVVSLFWFNPFIYLYRNALIEIHEYQADEAVVKRFKDPIGYQEILFSQLQSAQYSGMVSHFNVEIIKKRIVMMNKQNKMSGWVYALTLPVVLSVVFSFSSKEAMQPISQVGGEIATLLGPESIKPWADFWIEEIASAKFDKDQQDFTPSILPLKNTSNVKMTSGFGMRMHPIDKVEKMHKGMDFSCPMGSEVIATADGIVEKVEPNKDGYGNLLTLMHGEEYQTRYSQLKEFKVKVGDKVRKGDVIALSGNSGQSTAPHLHYEVIKGSEHVNPIYYIQNYNFQIKTREDGRSKEERYDALRKKEEELARNEMMLAKAEEERAAAESQLIKAKEAEERARVEIIRAEAYKAEAEKVKVEAQRVKEEEIKRKAEIKETKKVKEKDKSKSKDKAKEEISNHERLTKIEKFLKGYDEKYDSENWIIVLKDDRAKLKRVGSVESITLYEGFFAKN